MFKRLISLSLGILLVFNMVPCTMAEGTDEILSKYIETVYFWDDFQSVKANTFPRVFGLGETVNGWTRNGYNAEQVFSFEKEESNIYLKYQNTTGHNNEREIQKALNGEISAGSNVRITLKYKYSTGATNVFGLYIFGQEFYFRPNKNGFYSGVAGGAQFANATVPDEWNNVEILLFSKEDADYYEYYLEGNLVSEGVLASRMTSSSKVLLKQKQNNLGIAYATNKYVCFDDIRISTLEEKATGEHACEFAANKISNLFENPLSESVTLPSYDENGTTMTSWISSDESVITNEGVITRDYDEDKSATLTVNISNGGFNKDYSFTVTVKKRDTVYEKAEILTENFESPQITQTTPIAPGESFNGWTRQSGDTGTGFKYEIASETAGDSNNQFLQYYHTGESISDYRTFKKALPKTIPAGSKIELSFKLKKESGYSGLFEITLGKAAFLFRMSNNYMYPGKYSNSANTAVAAIPADEWNEIKFVIQDAEESATYEYYLNGTKVTAGIPAYGGTHSGITDVVLGEISVLSMRSWTNSNAGAANKKLYFDDIKLSIFKEIIPDDVAYRRVAKTLENLFATPLTENIELPLAGAYDTTIDWHSSNEAIITNEGIITRALDEDRVTTITATISRGDSNSKEYPFTVTVEEIISDEKACRETYEYYTTLFSGALEDNAELSAAGLYNTSVEWTSSDETIITNKGRITRSLEDKQTTLTAVIKRGEVTREETFTVTVKGIGSYIVPTQETLQKIVDGFLFSEISDESPLALSKDLELMTAYNRYEAAAIEGGVKIEWESSEPAILSNDGVLNRAVKEAKTVTLTATFTAASDEKISAAKRFSLTLLPKGKVYFYEIFDTPVVPTGTSIENWNGWSATYSKPTDTINVYDSFYTIEKETDTNKVFQFYRPTSNGSSIMRTASKKLTETINGGEVSLRMRVKRKNSAANSLVVWVTDSAGKAMSYNLEFSKSRVRSDSNIYPMFNMNSTATGIDTWQTFEFIFKLDEQKFECYHDGVMIAEDYPMVSTFNGTISSFVIYSTRNMGVNESCVYVDDIVMTQVTDKIADADAAAKVADVLKAKFQGKEIYEDFPLETAGEYKSTILWSSSDSDVIKVINGKGVVTNNDVTDTAVTLTAEIIRGSVKTEKEVTVNVPRFTGKVAPTQDMLQKAADNFTFDELTDEKETLLTHDLTLPTVYNKGYGKKMGGVNISWSSSKPNVVTNDGKITKQKYDTFLTLTAEFSATDNPLIKVTKEFKIAVLAEGEFILNDGFEDASFDLMNKTFAQTGKQLESGGYRKDIYGGWTLSGSNPGMEMYTDTVLCCFPDNPYEKVYNYTRKYRGNKAGVGYTTPNVTFTYKELDKEYQSGTLYISSRFYLTNANSRIDMMALDTKGRFSSTSSANCNIYYCAGQNLTTGELKGIVSLNKWHTLTFVMQLSGDIKVGHRYDVFVDGVKINKNQFVTSNGYPIYALAISSIRTSDGPDSNWYADDISIRHTSYDVTEDVQEAASALTLSVSGALTGDITLPTQGINGTRIIWSSSDENVVSSGGKVYFDGNSHSVTLNATIVKEDVSVTKSFTLNVASAAESTKYEIVSLKNTDGIITGATVKNNGFSGNAVLITRLYSRGDLMEVRVSALTGAHQEEVTFAKPLDAGNYLKSNIKAYIYDVDTNKIISKIYS